MITEILTAVGTIYLYNKYQQRKKSVTGQLTYDDVRDVTQKELTYDDIPIWEKFLIKFRIETIERSIKRQLQDDSNYVHVYLWKPQYSKAFNKHVIKHFKNKGFPINGDELRFIKGR